MSALAARPWSAALLAAVLGLALLAPLLPLRDPAAQPDGLLLADRPPLWRAQALRMRDGTLRFADAIERGPDTYVRTRAGRTEAIPAAEVAAVEHPLYLLGTDGYGRDLLSRLIWGARTSLLVGTVAAAIALLVGTCVGLVAGWSGGILDGLLMRATDAALSVPRLFLALCLAALWGRSLTTTVVVLGLTSWMGAARLVRGEVLSARGRDYVRAAEASGARGAAIAFRHLLPAAAGVLAAEAALRVGSAVLLEATMSFLGLGVPPPAPSWGNVLADGRDRLASAPWIATLPGLALALTVAAVARLSEPFTDEVRSP
ncbi:MAG TPA: ABC transporter permease [Candidatus Polarisedimenticolaceae bacterium]|nr:ABC transporter permease [Candidatus Polarisedimenticolaceae bacterium]